MRTFIAIDITAEIRERLIEFVEKHRPLFANARWIRPEGAHITLKFLGEIDLEQKDRIEAALSRVKATPFDIRVRGVGFFPGTRAPRVLWAGTEAGEPLAALASYVEKELAPLGFAKEKQAYRPHLTLARLDPKKTKNSASAAQDLIERPQPDFGTMTATEFFLYQSKLSPHGSHYAKLARFVLQ